jgi:hypothetical protein
MLGLFAAPFAVLIELNFLGDKLFVLAGPVIYPFAISASQFYKSIL